MTVVAQKHIDVDEQGVARIAGHRNKVIQLVMDRMINRWGPEMIQDQYPHLTMAQIHAAFAYYYEHQEELDAQIEQSIEKADKHRARSGESALVQKLRATGRLP